MTWAVDTSSQFLFALFNCSMNHWLLRILDTRLLTSVIESSRIVLSSNTQLLINGRGRDRLSAPWLRVFDILNI